MMQDFSVHRSCERRIIPQLVVGFTGIHVCHKEAIWKGSKTKQFLQDENRTIALNLQSWDDPPSNLPPQKMPPTTPAFIFKYVRLSSGRIAWKQTFPGTNGKFTPNKERIVSSKHHVSGVTKIQYLDGNMQTTHEEIQFKLQIFVPKKLQDVFGGFKSGL